MHHEGYQYLTLRGTDRQNPMPDFDDTAAPLEQQALHHKATQEPLRVRATVKRTFARLPTWRHLSSGRSTPLGRLEDNHFHALLATTITPENPSCSRGSKVLPEGSQMQVRNPAKRCRTESDAACEESREVGHQNHIAKPSRFAQQCRYIQPVNRHLHCRVLLAS